MFSCCFSHCSSNYSFTVLLTIPCYYFLTFLNTAVLSLLLSVFLNRVLAILCTVLFSILKLLLNAFFIVLHTVLLLYHCHRFIKL